MSETKQEKNKMHKEQDKIDELKKLIAAFESGETLQVGSFTPLTTLAGLIWSFNDGHKITIKPRTININGYEVPEPLRECELGDNVFIVDTWAKEVDNTAYGRNLKETLEAGFIHGTEENAQKHLDAIASFTKQ